MILCTLFVNFTCPVECDLAGEATNDSSHEHLDDNVSEITEELINVFYIKKLFGFEFTV